ncbi:MAG: VOC family protein [Microthrixaceae bacterium]
MDQRISLITLGVADVDASLRFYEQLGWQGQEVEETVFFQAGGLAVVLWAREKLADDAGIRDDGNATFGGIALAHNVRTRGEVDRLIEVARDAGAEITKSPSDTFYGGYAAYFRDPDGHVWEVAYNPGFTLAEDGSLTLPDF